MYPFTEQDFQTLDKSDSNRIIASPLVRHAGQTKDAIAGRVDD